MPIPSITYTEEQLNKATEYFEQNPTAVKFSRKQSGFPYSFIRTNDQDLQNDIFIISKKVLGSGSNGVVKIGKNIKTNQIVAIKIILTEDNDDFWFQEVLILSKLNRLYGTTDRSSKDEARPGWLNKREPIAKYRNDVYNFKHYIFKIFFEGITLHDYFLLHKPSNIEIIKILLKILDELAILHKQGITHGDLNCKNIIINNSNNTDFDIKIIDFGLANQLSEEGIRAFPVHKYRFSREHYLPPECDPSLSKNLFSDNQIDNDILFKITKWAANGYGFSTTTSDIYSLIWSINYFCNRYNKQDLFLSYLYNVTCKKRCPILRPSLEEITTECQKQFEKLTLTP